MVITPFCDCSKKTTAHKVERLTILINLCRHAMQEFKEDDSHVFFLNLGAEAKSRKVIFDTVRYLAVRDVIMLGMGLQDPQKASSAWSDLRSDVKTALAPYLRKHQFPGAGSRPVDVITMRGAMQLLVMLPLAPTAILIRGLLVDTMCRVVAGDLTLIPEIQRNAASNGPMQQAAREILQDGMGPNAKGAASDAIVKGIHDVQQFAVESEGRVLKALDTQGTTMSESLSTLVKTLEEQAAEQGRIITARDNTIRAHEETIRAHEKTIVYLRGEKDKASELSQRQAYKLGQLRAMQTDYEVVQGARNVAKAKLIAADIEIKTLKEEVERQKRLANENKEELVSRMSDVLEAVWERKRARTDSE